MTLYSESQHLLQTSLTAFEIINQPSDSLIKNSKKQRMIHSASPLRALLLSGIAAAALSMTNARASVLLTIDYSDLSAVKFTATGAASDIEYLGGLTFADGIALRNFFTAPVLVKDFVSSYNVASVGLSDSNNDTLNGAVFTELSAWNDDNPGYWAGYGADGTGNGVDLTLWSLDNISTMYFDAGPFSPKAAFHGEAIFDLTGYADYTALFPSANSSGDITIWNNNGTLGTWQAIPEPSSYGLLGAGALTLVAHVRRRRRKQMEA